MHRRAISVIILASTLASIMFRTGPATGIARNRVGFVVTHANRYVLDQDIVTNSPMPRIHEWVFEMFNWEDETRQAVINPSVRVVTELEFVDFWPEPPVISDGEYAWNFHLDVPDQSIDRFLSSFAVRARESNYLDYHSPGFSAERRLSPEVLVEPITIQNLSLTFTLEDPLPTDVDTIGIGLGYPKLEERLVNYTVLWLNDVQDWTAGTDSWYANPSDLSLGKTYHFQAILEVVKSAEFRVLVAKPWIAIIYQHWENLATIVGSSATVTHPDGPRVTMSAEGNYEWYPSLGYSEQDFTLDRVEKPPPPPSVDFAYHPETSWVDESIMFDASTSSSSYNLTSYGWDFGDGNVTTVTVPVIEHVYGREGRYTVALNVTDVYGLWNFTSCPFAVTFRTDINRDCKVNIQDITLVAVAYKTKPGDQKWNPMADLDKSGEIDIIDISMVARDYGKTIQ